MRQAIAGTMLVLATLAAPVARADGPVVVELFTSQGCSSCPPADEMLRALAARGDVIALALHVDYWDYIGWADSFAHASFTDRQEAYARARGDGTIYTPQFIVNGHGVVAGADAMALMERLDEAAAATSALTLAAGREGGAVRIVATGDPGPGLVVHLVRYRPSETVEILHGENAGSVIDYTNIVTDWSVVGEWNAPGDLSLTVPFADGDPAVVLLQSPEAGPIVASARVD